MQTNPNHVSCADRLGGATAAILLAATLVMISGRAHAQNYPVATVAPGHMYVVRGFSIRNGDYLVLEPPVLFFFGPIRPRVTLVARPMLGVGGSGAGIGLAMNLMPSRPGGEPRTPAADYFMGPFVSLEAHIERMYGPTNWRSATYAGPQLSLSLYVLKASLGWMVDPGDGTDHHVQIALGGGF